MMIVMRPTATAEEAEHVARLARDGMPGVDHMLPISKPDKLASGQITHGARSVLDIAGRKVGGDQQEMTHLPVIVDPSHAAGRRDLVGPMSLAAAAALAGKALFEDPVASAR